MVPSPLDKQTAGCNLPHDWLMSLAMDLAALCICEGENGTNGCHLAAYSVDIAFSHHFIAPHHPPPFTPIEVLVVLAAPVKNYLKWWAIQLVIIRYLVHKWTMNSYRIMTNCMQASVFLLILQIIKTDISGYL